MRASEFITEYKTDPKLEDYEGLRFKIDVHDFYHQINVSAYPPKSNKEIGRVLFDILDHRQLEPLDLQVDEKFRGQGIAKIMYDYVKSKGYAIHRSWDQTEAGAKFWNKNRGEDVRIWEDVPQPGESSGAPKQFGPDAKIETRQMTVKQIITSIPGVPYYNNVVDDWDAKDYSWGVTKKTIEYATYLKEHPDSLAKLPPILVLNGKFEDGAHRVSAIWLLQQRMDPKNPLWANAKLNVQFIKQGVAEGSNAGDIELSHSMSPDMLYVHAISDGTDVGGARFKKIDGEWTGDIVHVYPQFRRQGIATKIYDYAEDLVGKIIPSKTLKPKGKKFWDNRDKQGVAEDSTAHDCKHCNGKGYHTVTKKDGTKVATNCPQCKGKGYIVTKGVAEAFNQPYSLQWENGEFGDYDAYTKLPDGSNLSIMFNKEDDDVYAIEFWRNNSQDATGDGDSQRVFATVLSAIQEFLTTKAQPRFISFTGAKGEDDKGKDSRVSLYSKLLQRYATSWGYKLKNVFDRSDAVVFDLVRIKQDVAEVVNKELWHPERMFKQRVPIGDYEFEAREAIGGMGDYDANALTIIAYDPRRKKNKQMIGNANFVVKGRGSKRSLVSDDTYVDPKYRGEGIATMMYAYAKSLGNDIKGSNIQTQMGKKMWANWGSDAEHLKGNK